MMATFLIKNKSENKRIQNLLFRKGYSWIGEGGKRINNCLDFPIGKYGSIIRSFDMDKALDWRKIESFETLETLEAFEINFFKKMKLEI